MIGIVPMPCSHKEKYMAMEKKLGEKRPEAALRESEERFRTIFEGSRDAIFLVTRDARIAHVNQAACDLTGYDRDELLAMRIPDLHAPEDLHAYARFFDRIMAGEALISESDILRKDGVKVPTEFSNARVTLDGAPYMHTLARDVADRKRTEVELQRSLEKFEKTFHAAPIWVVLSALEDGRYIDVNEAYLKTMGFKREEVIGKTSVALDTWVDPGDRDRFVGRVKKQGGIRKAEVRRRTRSGEIIDTLFSAETMRLGEEQVMISMTLDITDRKRAEAEKARLEARFHQARKLESIGRLAGGVAHDLNNLLSPIIGYGEMLLEDAAAGDPRREPTTQILKAAKGARNLVRQLLAFSRRQPLEFKSIDLNGLLRNFEKLLRRAIREDIALRMTLAPSLPAIQGDMGQLEQVVMNLAVNAQDAMPDGGVLTIDTRRVSLNPGDAAVLDGPAPGPCVRLTVQDTGRGFDPEIRESLFEPFFTTKGDGKGTGLGLATVYGIVKQHGGAVRARSEPGEGAAFTIYLPASTKKPAEDRQAAPAPVLPRGAETVLLVEDNAQVRDLTFTILEREGYTVLTAGSGGEAMAALDHHEGPLHLLLTDVVMPDMNGRQLFDRVSERYPDLKVLYMSGYAENVIARRGVMDPGVHFIQKPFSVKVMAARIREALDG